MWPFTNKKIKQLERRIGILEAFMEFTKSPGKRFFGGNNYSKMRSLKVNEMPVKAVRLKRKYVKSGKYKQSRMGHRLTPQERAEKILKNQQYHKDYYHQIWKKRYPLGKKQYNEYLTKKRAARKTYEHKYPPGYIPLSSVESVVKMTQENQTQV